MKPSLSISQRILEKIFAGRKAQEVLDQLLAKIPAPNRPLIADLTYGTLRYHIFLENCLREKLKKFGKLPSSMRVLLEISLYSLLYQSGSKPYAVVNETVGLIKKSYGTKMASVANAVLRAFMRQVPVPAFVPIEDNATYLSLPSDLFELWKISYGQTNALKLAHRSLNRPYHSYRINRYDSRALNISASLSTMAGVEFVGRAGIVFPPGRLPAQIANQDVPMLIREGALSSQSAGSMEILKVLGIFQDWRKVPVWDACAGYGGKTADMLEAGLEVELASDTSLARLCGLTTQCKRLGLAAPKLCRCSAILPPLKEWSGNILADVPCSGTGVLARRPDIKLHWSKERTSDIVNVQRQILSSLASLLKPGRELCYITCALNPEENELQIKSLLNTTSNLQLITQWVTPFDHPWLEGMYGARIVKI